MGKKELLAKILFEGKSYKSYEDIEKLVELESDLSMVPVQPLYVSLLSTNTDLIATVLPKLSKIQRQAFIDLDLWQKDHVDVSSFEYWIEVYSKLKDLDIIQDFVSSDDFLLYLKSRVNIYTFDSEDPQYPDHDYYFLTDDTLLLVEYSEEFKYPHELKFLIRNMYDKFGVENAYSLLFKLVNDSFAVIQEKQYQEKKERLRELGFVDYYDALEGTYSFVTYKQVDNFIKDKTTITPSIDNFAKNQSLHSSALTSFDEKMDSILSELSKIEDEKRLSFLQFNFLRLINSTITLNDSLRGGSVELSRIGKSTRAILEFGLNKVKTDLGEDEIIFERFDFFDLYRIGKSLLQIEKNRIKKSLRNTPFEKDEFEYFLGAWWNSFLENSDLEIPKVKTYGAATHSKDVLTMNTYSFWKAEVSLFVKSVPFMSSFFDMLNTLKTQGKLHDDFYLNYTVDNIDFESILISSFINFSLGQFSGNDVNKMGVTIGEIKEFFKLYFVKSGEEYILKDLNDGQMKDACAKFIEQYGFESIDHFDKYLHGVLMEHLSGYEFDTLSNDDYKHIGGPILLNTLIEN